jgi:hypothetical protein
MQGDLSPVDAISEYYGTGLRCSLGATTQGSFWKGGSRVDWGKEVLAE